eukprot:201973-Alexandrium_andersonii.AAC.1
MSRTRQWEKEGGHRRILHQCPVASTDELCVRTCGVCLHGSFDGPACMSVVGQARAVMLSC